MIKARFGSRRRGMSILETVVVMGSVAVALGLATLLIQIMLRLGSADQARLSASVALARFASGLRADAHAATDCRIEKTGGFERLVFVIGTGGSVEYRPKDSRILRESTLAGKARGRDECVLARGGSARFETRSIDGLKFVALVVHPPADKSGSTAPPLEILAAVGKDRNRGTISRREAK